MIRALAVYLAITALATLIPADRADALISAHQCAYCHTTHLALGDTLLHAASVEALCLSCHGPAGISVLKAEVHTDSTIAPSFRHTCLDCHNPHDNIPNWKGGENIALVGLDLEDLGVARILTPNSGIRNVVFENRTAFTQGSPDYDGACETCHTLTRFHRNTADGTHTHQVDTTCTSCHNHGNYFLR